MLVPCLLLLSVFLVALVKYFSFSTPVNAPCGVSEYIKKVLADAIFMVTYDKAEEMIIFGYEVIQGGEDIHTYSDTDNTIYITRKE